MISAGSRQVTRGKAYLELGKETASAPEDYRRYSVSRHARQPLLDFMLGALRACGCRIVSHTDAGEAPFRIVFDAPEGERMGIVAYAFLATRTPTRNRPADERSFQIKYGTKEPGELHPLWQDPSGLYTTLFLGIDTQERFFVAPDPEMHNPTLHFIRFEFKDSHADAIKAARWHVWERQKKGQAMGMDEPIEVVVGGVEETFLRYVLFERAAKGLSQGDRQLLAEKKELVDALPSLPDSAPPMMLVEPHPLTREFGLSEGELMGLIAGAPRLKMAVRGWVAEEHLRAALTALPGVTECQRLTFDGSPDILLRYRDGRPITIECKNVLRNKTAAGLPRVDFQRTRAAKADPCSRYYTLTDFNILAACLHAVTEQWEFRYIFPASLAAHLKCPGKLASNVVVGQEWLADPIPLLERM